MKKIISKFSALSFVTGIAAGAIVTTAVGQGSLGSLIFPDVPSGAYYDGAVGEMVSLGVITGFGDGTFKPNEPLTRGQAAVLMQRLRNEIKGIVVASSSSSISVRSRSSSSSSSSSSSVSSASSAGSIPSAGLVRFTTSQYKVDENDGNVSITLVRAGGNRGQVTVDYTLVPETATEDEDYEKQEGTVMFESGKTSVKFDVTITDDSDQEGDETFKITLGEVGGGAGKTYPEEATVVIDDDETADSSSSTASVSSGPEEGTIGFSATEYSVDEAEGEIIVRVVRNGGSKGSVSVDYSMVNGTADSSNYNRESGTVSFADGETEKNFTVTVNDIGTITGNKTVLLSLSGITGGAEYGHKASTLTIYDNEVGTYGSGSLKFSATQYEALESDGEAVITVRRVGGAEGEVSVKYLTIAGTASAGTDYKNVDNVLTFIHGEAAKTFSIPVYKDSLSDGGETVNVRLQDPTGGATITSPSFATLYIY